MNELLCGSEKYCVCHGSNCDEKKWKVVKGEYSNLVLDTEADKIKISRDAARNKKESQVPVVTVLSSVQAGLYGTLKAQFKIPKIDVSVNLNLPFVEYLPRININPGGYVLQSDALFQKVLPSRVNHYWQSL